MATSGPSEPWRNADDFAEYSAIAAKRHATLGGKAAVETKVGGVGKSMHLRGRPAMEAGAVAAPTALAASASSLHLSLSQAGAGAGLDGTGDRPRSSSGFYVGERKGGALFDHDEQGLGYVDVGGVGGGGDGVGGASGGMMLDSVGVDLGSA